MSASEFLGKKQDELIVAALIIGLLGITFGVWPFNNLKFDDQWSLMVVDVLALAGFCVYRGISNIIDKAAERGERKNRY